MEIKILKSIYHETFESHPCYTALVRVQNSSSVKRLRIRWKNLLRLAFFQNGNGHTGIENSKILKSSYKVALENCILISKSLHKTLAEILFRWFIVSFESRTYNTRWTNKGCINFPFHHTKSYVRYSVAVSVVYAFRIFCKVHTSKPYSVL